jgi:hypothetical protein
MLLKRLNELSKLHEINGKNAIDQCKDIIREELDLYKIVYTHFAERKTGDIDYDNGVNHVSKLIVKGINNMLKEVEE